ncbi:MAG: glycosyltransferase [Alistipes sp.]
MIRLSLIIATYNRAEPLSNALRSVIGQTAPATTWECVVVNNNSTDDTAERFAAFQATYPDFNLRLVHESKQGLSSARNRGIVESKGSYIAIIDDDERINPDFIAAYIAFFDAYPDAMAAGGKVIPEYKAGRPRWMSCYTEQPIANPMDWGDLICVFPAGHIPAGGNMAFRRTALVRYGVFDPTLGRSGKSLIGGEESDLFERLARAGEQAWYLPQAVIWHIIPPEKLTEAYFDRLCFQVGVSQRRRAELYNRVRRLFFSEGCKWIITLLLSAFYCILFRFSKARYLLKMRYQITAGLTQK